MTVFGHFTGLVTLNLSDNHIATIHPIFASFKHLKHLDISDNELSRNDDPQVFQHLPASLEILRLTGDGCSK